MQFYVAFVNLGKSNGLGCMYSNLDVGCLPGRMKAFHLTPPPPPPNTCAVGDCALCLHFGFDLNVWAY